MIRRWYLPLTTMALVLGSWLAAGSAFAAPLAAHAATPRSAAAVAGFTPGGRLIGPAGPARPSAPGALNAEVESSNWSGYAATGASGAFSSVSASWTEPTATCSSGGRRSAQYAAFWVGLDGYNSNSVEQTGTDSDCVGRTPDYYGWYEMYPAAPVYFSNTVRPGDALSASVTFSGTETYTLVLRDSTQGWTQTITQNEAGLARSSAEVITEAPSSNTGVLPLANFGTVNYAGAEANGTALASLSPTEIIMADSSGLDKDSTSAISGGAFSNTWLRST
jgi:Peptidase A4 family